MDGVAPRLRDLLEFRKNTGNRPKGRPMDIENIGKWIMLAGLFLVVLGAIVWGASKLGIPLGNLPGDIRVEGRRSSIYFPIVTCIVVSIVLTLVLNIIGRYMR